MNLKGCDLELRAMMAAEDSIFLTMESWLCAVSIFITLLSMVSLIKYFQNNTDMSMLLKIHSIIPLFFSIILSASAGFVFNTSIIPSINSHYPFIDKHCDILYNIIGIGNHLIRYTTWLFYLSRIKYYFENSKLFKLSTFSYHINILIYTSLTVLSIYFHLTYSAPLKCVAYKPLDGDNRSCMLIKGSNMETDVNIIITSILNEGIISIFLLYLMYIKTNGLEIQQKNNDTLSVFYSQRDNATRINTKIMRRCLFFGLMALLTHWLAILLLVFVEFRYLFPLATIMNNMSILASFDLDNPLSVCIGSNRNNTNDMQLDDQIEMTEFDRDQYLNKMMMMYYAEPSHLQQ